MHESRQPYREERPWGEFIEFTHNEPTTVKILIVEPGEAFSLQYHDKRDEYWYVLSGDGIITVGDAELPIRPGESHTIPRGTHHRIAAGTSAVHVLEISSGDFDENDIKRLDDRYGRT